MLYVDKKIKKHMTENHIKILTNNLWSIHNTHSKQCNHDNDTETIIQVMHEGV